MPPTNSPGIEGRDDDQVAPGFRRLFSPLTIGDIELRNRIVLTTHGTRLSEERELLYLRTRASGGAGLIGLSANQGITSYRLGPDSLSPQQAWDSKEPSPLSADGVAYYDDVVIPKLQRLSGVIHSEGAKCYAQVYHPGAAPHFWSLDPPMSPSGVVDPYESLASHVLTDEEIRELIFAFAQGIRRIHLAGVDAAELHAAHGYLIHQFLSPYSNRRTDEWGGSRENRVRFALEIIAEARKLVGPRFAIGIRVGIDGDGRARGLTIEELAETCRLLSPHVAYISVSGGSYTGFGDGYESAYVGSYYQEPGHNAAAAAEVKRRVNVPVMVAGRIADPSIAEGILADGRADLIGMVRALIADPDLPDKARTGRAGEVRMCLGLAECHYVGLHRTPVMCAVNPAAGREKEFIDPPTTRTHPTPMKTVVVAGAGPAGMEAARIAAQRGHTVFLADSNRVIGGIPRLLAADPNRRNLLDQAVYFESELKRLGVTMMLGNRVSVEEMIDFAPDVVVVATGATPLIPEIEGIGRPNVLTALDVLRGSLPSTNGVVVVSGLDAHLAGPTIADFLADQGFKVDLISEHVDFAKAVEDGTRMAILARLRAKGIPILLTHRLVKIEDNTVVVMDTLSHEKRTLSDRTVVLACGMVANDSLARELSPYLETRVVGDALAPRRIVHATLDGARVGQAL
ncbi:MAG: FAD-dependent oxidoreductase [Acidimicrobiales bacterium]